MPESLTLRTGYTCDLDEASRAEIVRVCSDAFRDDASILFRHLPPDGLHVLGLLGGVLVSHAVRTTRWAQVAGHPVFKTAYIDAVATLGEVQGMGYGSRVVRCLTEEIFKEDYQLCALETDRPGFYTRLGWEIWPGSLGGRKDEQVIATPEAQGHVLVLRTPHTPPIDLHSLMTIEEQGRFW